MKVLIATAFALAATAGAAWANAPAMPKVMSDAPPGDGRWKMEMVQAPGAPKGGMGGMGNMTVCTTAAKAASGPPEAAAKDSCRHKMVEDGATRAVMEVACRDGSTRLTITRLAARSYEMSVQPMDKPGEAPVVMRMSYLGTCSASDSAVSMDKDSPACRQMRAGMAGMSADQAKAACAQAGPNRAACEQQIAQMMAMCGGK